MKKLITMFVLCTLTLSLFASASAANYTVKAGDSLGKIAQEFHVSIADIAKANGISNPNVIREGQVLVIPEKGTTTTPEGNNTPTFVDVYKYDSYYNAVVWAYTNGIVNGTSSTTFEPNIGLSRAMFVTMVYRMYDEPNVANTSHFTDVPYHAWYGKAVEWAAREGIVNGITATEFAPNMTLSREQLVTILYRIAGQPKASGISNFGDANAISDYAKSAVLWAEGINLIPATKNFAPQGIATRGWTVEVLYNMMGIQWFPCEEH